jgi:hypothetical protein
MKSSDLKKLAYFFSILNHLNQADGVSCSHNNLLKLVLFLKNKGIHLSSSPIRYPTNRTVVSANRIGYSNPMSIVNQKF